ncbi:MAG TPA: hypothetical protein VL403_09195 [Candidatus Kryptonia bacterium]|nr:hypothetical protein [Candidatus Kryptonia bacterium]
MLILAILGIGWLISSGCLFHLWFARQAALWRKVSWSIVLFVPYVGALFYGALFHPLPAQAEHLRARENPDVYSVTPGDLR